MRLRKPRSRASKASDARARPRPRADVRQRPAGRREAAKDRYGKAAQPFSSVARGTGVELLGISRELIRVPAAVFMRVAEILGQHVLRAWLYVWPLLLAAWKLAGRALAYAARVVTPARITVLVALLTALALAGSQWADLRGITIGTDNYAGLEEVAPAPQVETQTVGSAHAWVGIPLAVIAALIVLRSATGRPKLARLLVGVGVAVVVMSLAVDRPEGLDKGQLEIQYQSVTATLLTGFWAQLVSGVILILLAPLLIRVLSPEAESAGRRPRERKARIRMPALRGPKRAGRAAEAQR